MTTGEKIAKLRKEAGYSQETLSEKLDISRQTVSKWEKGTAQPTSENLARIAGLFDVGLSYLMDDNEENIICSEIYEAEHNEPEVSQKKKLFTAHRMMAGFLVLVVLVQTLAMAKMQRQINSLEGVLNMTQTRLESLSSVVGLYAGNAERKEPDTASFTDYSWQVLSYDRDTNIAQVRINVLPLDYSRSTAVRFALKTDDGMEMIDAQFENHLFTTVADVSCTEGLPLYMYLTDGEKVRSYLIDYLPDFSDDYKLNIFQLRETGHYTISVENGTLDLNNTTVSFMLDYRISADENSTIYPEFAVIQILCDGRVIHETEVEQIINTDYRQKAKEDPSYEEGSSFWGTEHIYQRLMEYGNTKIKDREVFSTNQIGYRLVIIDNHGMVYEKETPLTVY